MPESFFSGMIAYQQALMLLGGAFFLAIGALLLGNDLYWHAKAARVAGIITGLRRKNNVYYPVYRYQLPDGQVFEMTSITGSSLIDDKPTGKMVPLLYFPEDPKDARPAGSYAYAAGSLFFLLPGAPLVYDALAHYPLTQASWFMIGGILFFCALQIRHFESRKPRRFTLLAWKALMKEKHEAELRAFPLLRLEDIVAQKQAPASPAATDPATATTAAWTDAAPAARPAPRRSAALLLLAGIVLVVTGLWIGLPMQEILIDGTAAAGKVTEMKTETTAAGARTFPVISFVDKAGDTVAFPDAAANDPAEFALGASVDVIYLPRDPWHTALVDRGMRTWEAVMLAVLALGNGCLFAGLYRLRRK